MGCVDRHPQIKYVEVSLEPEVIYTEIEKEAEETVEVGERPYYETIANSITDSEIELLAKLVYEEARGESILGQKAVVEVVLNRMLDKRFPNTVHDVIYQDNPTQFSPAYKLKSTVPTKEQYEVVTAALEESEPILASKVVFFSTGTNGYTVYKKIGNHYFCY
jgi:N-acetylmuramoyl-L-alanine amidase